MTEEERKAQDKKIYEAALKMMDSFEVPYEIFRIRHSIYWLHEIEDYEIEQTVKSLWCYAELHKGRIPRSKYDYWLKGIEYELMHEMEQWNPDIVSSEEHKLRFLAIELLINICSYIVYTDDFVYITPLITDEEIETRIEDCKKNPRYKDMFTYTTKENIFFKKYLEQYKSGVPMEEIKVDLDECEKECEINKNKIRDKDKRVKFRDIEMIDADTKEVVHTFKDRAECIEMTGISKSRLSQILTHNKIQQRELYKYNGWQTWKDKDNNKTYYFHEKYKDM